MIKYVKISDWNQLRNVTETYSTFCSEKKNVAPLFTHVCLQVFLWCPGIDGYGVDWPKYTSATVPAVTSHCQLRCSQNGKFLWLGYVNKAI